MPVIILFTRVDFFSALVRGFGWFVCVKAAVPSAFLIIYFVFQVWVLLSCCAWCNGSDVAGWRVVAEDGTEP